MKTKPNLLGICLLWAMLLPAVAWAQFTYVVSDGALAVSFLTRL